MSKIEELQVQGTSVSEPRDERVRRLGRLAGAVATIAVFVAALVVLHYLLREVSLRSIAQAFRDTAPDAAALSLLFTAGSYIALTFYDYLAVQHLGRKLPYRATALAAFTSFTFAHNLGLAGLTGGSIRYRIYSNLGVPGSDIALIVGLCGVIFWLGVLTLLGTALVLEPAVLSKSDLLSSTANMALGAVCLGIVAVYIAYGANGRQSFQFRGLKLCVPGWRATAKQILAGVVDNSCAAAALYCLLPSNAGLSFPAFFGIYVVAITLGFLSHTPAGIGVFEAIILIALPDVPKDALLASILMYRVIYYLIPLALGAGALALHELRQREEVTEKIGKAVKAVKHVVAPYLIGALVLFSGVVLLVSGATPAESARIHILRDFIPLPFVEASHFLGSIVGLWLRDSVARADAPPGLGVVPEHGHGRGGSRLLACQGPRL